MGWNLWLDDERDPRLFLRVRPSGIMAFEEFRPYLDMGFSPESFVWCKNTEEAIAEIGKRGLPSFMALDHDLGTEDVFKFLSWFTGNHNEKAPAFKCHSSNPEGRRNVVAYLNSWNKSLEE